MVLIKWIETLHSITNVNILKSVPRFLNKLFLIVESQAVDKQSKTEVSKKSLDQLRLFLEDFKVQSSRSLELDQEIIIQLNKFLKSQKSSSMGKGLYEALYWLRRFIDFFEIDYKLTVKENEELVTAEPDSATQQEFK